MAKRITMNGQSRKPLAEVFNEFVISQTAQGLSETTLLNYRHHLHSISNHLDIQKSMESLQTLYELLNRNAMRRIEPLRSTEMQLKQ